MTLDDIFKQYPINTTAFCKRMRKSREWLYFVMKNPKGRGKQLREIQAELQALGRELSTITFTEIINLDANQNQNATHRHLKSGEK